MQQEKVILFHRLSFVPEGEDVVVGRVDTGSYAVLPADGAELLQRLSEGMAPQQAADWFEANYDEAVDIDDFLESLADLGFVRSVDDAQPINSAPRLQWLGRLVFSRLAWLVYLAIGVSWLAILASHRDIRPAPSQLFFSDSLLAMQLVIIASQFPTVCLHEGFHVLAGQRLGLASKLSISNRFSFIVVETQSNGLLSLPRRRRYLPFLAGMLADIIVLACLGIAAELTRSPGGALSLGGRICLAVGFTVVSRLLWQFLLYLRTDLYYVIATALNCHDLHEASKAILKNRFWRAIGKTERLWDESQWTQRDLKVGRWYGYFLVLGFATAATMTCFISIPVLTIYLRRLVHALSSGTGNGLFWDSAFSLFWTFVQFCVPAYLARRKRRIARRPGPRLLMNPGEV
ncbi:MAG: PqqD family protein [Actinomycetota bacterium]|nr:PqqD family protein [Actinomycetota bacterium]